MIPVTQAPEPADFNIKVRVPGQAFLAKNPTPTTEDYKNRDYWKEAAVDLYNAYNKICAYSAFWIPRGTGQYTVDHFMPKKNFPALAYEWDNFRLSSGKMNSRKWSHQDIIDPFEVQSDWFIIEFPSLTVKANNNFADAIVSRVEQTITRLNLNDEIFIEQRQSYIQPYCENNVTFIYLRQQAPFLAYEIERQGLLEEIKNIMIF